MWTNIALFVILALLAWFRLLRPALSNRPPSPSPPASGLMGVVQRLEEAWQHGGQTWKRWACVVAGAFLMWLAQATFGIFGH